MLSLRIALRYLFSRKSHNAVNIITLISLAGVAVATIATVCVLSVFNGFTNLAYQRLSVLDPQLLVERSDGRIISDGDSLASAIAAVTGVEIALPTLSGQAFAIYDGSQVPVRLKGVPGKYDRLTGINDVVIDGQYLGEDNDFYDRYPDVDRRSFAALSIGVASQLASTTGFSNLLEIYVPRRTARINPANPLGSVAADSVIASAVFQVNQPEWDDDIIILPLSDVRRLLEYTSESSAIEIGLQPGTDESDVKAAVAKKIGNEYVVKTRIEQQMHSYRMIQVEKWISFLLLAFIMVIASFNIVSTLSILVIEKQDNMRTLTALGAPRKLISRIFMTEGWLVSLAGGVVGVIIGVALCLAQQWWGFVKLQGDAASLTIDAYPVKVEVPDLLVVLALVALVGLLSTLVTRGFIRSRLEQVQPAVQE